MRKLLQGITVFFMVLVVAFFGLKDVVIKNILEKELTNSLGTKVRIYGVDYSIFKELLELKGIGIESKENDARDIIYIENITTKLNYKELFNKKIKVDSVDIKNISLDVETDRKNERHPLLNARQEIASTNVERLSDDEIEEIVATILNNYKILLNTSENNTEELKKSKKIFLAAITPVVDKYINYKIGSYAEEYILGIIKEYRALSNNIQIGFRDASKMEWSIEIGVVNLTTNLFGREFGGMISEISTDKTKMDKNISFVLESLLGGETGRIIGTLNPYKMQGEIKTIINNVDITQVKEIKDYAKGIAFLNQNIYLDGDKIGISGDVEVKSIILNKENIAKEFLDGNVDSFEKITGNLSDRIGNMEITYKYKPTTRRVTVNSNIAEEIGIYMGADVSELKKLEREIKEKYGDDIKRGKEEIKAKFEGFLKSFK